MEQTTQKFSFESFRSRVAQLALAALCFMPACTSETSTPPETRGILVENTRNPDVNTKLAKLRAEFCELARNNQEVWDSNWLYSLSLKALKEKHLEDEGYEPDSETWERIPTPQGPDCHIRVTRQL
jgi:hypothetical protein